MSSTKSRKPQRGAAALEFALVAPLLIILIFGVVDFGMMINSQAVFANATRDGARTGSFFGTKSEITSVITSETSYLNGLVENVQVNVTCRKPTGTACSNYDLDREPGDTVSVKITFTHRWLTPGLLGLPSTSTITKTSEMRIE